MLNETKHVVRHFLLMLPKSTNTSSQTYRTKCFVSPIERSNRARTSRSSRNSQDKERRRQVAKAKRSGPRPQKISSLLRIKNRTPGTKSQAANYTCHEEASPAESLQSKSTAKAISLFTLPERRAGDAELQRQRTPLRRLTK